jgi:hypothetical protein
MNRKMKEPVMKRIAKLNIVLGLMALTQIRLAFIWIATSWLQEVQMH